MPPISEYSKRNSILWEPDLDNASEGNASIVLLQHNIIFRCPVLVAAFAYLTDFPRFMYLQEAEYAI
jgi:hypothetical protein